MNLARILKHKLVRDTATLQLGSAVALAASLISAVLLAHVLGARGQGQYYVAIMLYSLPWFLLNPGIVAATITQVAAANARGQADKVTSWLAFLAKSYLLLALGLIALGLLVIPALARLASPGDAATAEFGARWGLVLTLMPLCELPRVVLATGLQATRTMAAFTRIEVGQELVRVFLVLTLSVCTGSPAGALIGTLAASALGSWIAWEQYAAARAQGGSLLPAPAAILAHLRDVPLRAGLTLGFKLGLCRSMDALAVQLLPTLFLQRYASSEWVAYTRLAQRLMQVPLLLLQSAGRVFMPRLSELAGPQHEAHFRRVFVRGSLLAGGCVIAGLAAMLLALPWIARLAFPPDYVEPLVRVAWILAPGLALLSFSIANETFYLVTGQLRLLIGLCAVILVGAGLAQWQLARTLPETGVAWGMALTSGACVLHYAAFALHFRRRSRAQLNPVATKPAGPGDSAR